MAWISDLLRSRGRIPLLWALTLCLLAAGVIYLATQSGPDKATKARAGGPAAATVNGVVNPVEGNVTADSVGAGAPGSTAAPRRGGAAATGPRGTGAPAANSASNGPVTVTWGPGTVTVSWVPFRGGVQYHEVVANEASLGYSGTLVSCGSCYSVTFKGLINGGRYTFTVTPRASGAAGPSLQSPVATPGSDLCPPGEACVAVDGTVPTGPSTGNAQGFLHSIDAQTDPSRVAALRPRFWRGSGGQAFHNLVKPYGVEQTEILSDYWMQYAWDNDRGGARPPWDDWNLYRSYISNTVTYARDHGWAPAYWEVQNEPDAGYPYVPGTNASIQNTLLVYKNGYEAIKAADPNARVLGPSLTGFTIRPVPGQPQILDLQTFFDFANANHLRFDAISLHETSADHLPPFDRRPEAAETHVARLRGEIAARWPNVGNPKIFIGEWGGGRTLSVPGWRVGYMASAEAAGVESASTSCWPFADVINCQAGTLGGLLDKDKATPRAGYWVHRAYADMRGTRIDTSGSVQSLSAFAVAGGAGGPWQVLLGRHQSCSPGVNPLCQGGSMPPAVGLTVAVRVGGPDRVLTISVQRIPNTNGAVPAPPATLTQAFTVRGGVGHVVLPAFADGEAYVLRIS